MSEEPPEWFDRLHGRPERDPEGDTWIDLSGEVRASTERAINFYDGSRTAWVARSNVRPSDVGAGPVEIEMRQWAAKQAGFI